MPCPLPAELQHLWASSPRTSRATIARIRLILNQQSKLDVLVVHAGDRDKRSRPLHYPVRRRRTGGEPCSKAGDARKELTFVVGILCLCDRVGRGERSTT